MFSQIEQRPVLHVSTNIKIENIKIPTNKDIQKQFQIISYSIRGTLLKYHYILFNTIDDNEKEVQSLWEFFNA